MKFHYQRVVDAGRGDCTRTAMACVLDLEPEDIPNFTEVEHGHQYWDGIKKWCAERGLGYLTLRKDQYDNWPMMLQELEGALCLVSVPSQRFKGGYHSVVGQIKVEHIDQNTDGTPKTWRSYIDIIHDPSPTNVPYPWYVPIQSLHFFIKPYDGFVHKSAMQTY